MSNRIAASRSGERIELAAWAPRMSWRRMVVAAVRRWLRDATARDDVFALSPHMRRDLGLPDLVAARDDLRDFGARWPRG